MGAKGIVEASFKGPPVAISTPEYPSISIPVFHEFPTRRTRRVLCQNSFASYLLGIEKRNGVGIIDFRVVTRNKCVRAMNKRNVEISMRDTRQK